MTLVFAASLLVTIPHVAWLTARCLCSDCSLPASFEEWPHWAHPSGPYMGQFFLGRNHSQIRIYVPNLVMIGPAVWPPILDRHTHTRARAHAHAHTHTHTEFVLYRSYIYLSCQIAIRKGVGILDTSWCHVVGMWFLKSRHFTVVNAFSWSLSSTRSRRDASWWTSSSALSTQAGCVSWPVSLRRICRSTTRCCQSTSFSACPFFAYLRLFPVVSLWLGRPILSRAHTISVSPLYSCQKIIELSYMFCYGFPQMLVSDLVFVGGSFVSI